MTNLAVEIGRCARAALRAPQRCFVLLIDDGLRFSQRCGGVDGLRVTTPCWECLWLHPFCPGARHSPCLARHAWFDTAFAWAEVP